MSRRGQGSLEFALVSAVLLTFLLGIMDFSYLFAGRLAAYEAARAAARYAAANPTAWSSAASPPASTIEGHLVLGAVPARVVNDDSHVTIAYYVPGGSALTKCGQYSAATNSFTASGSYTEDSCVAPGNVVVVTAIYTYTFITPFLKDTWTGLTITTTASALVET